MSSIANPTFHRLLDLSSINYNCRMRRVWQLLFVQHTLSKNRYYHELQEKITKINRASTARAH